MNSGTNTNGSAAIALCNPKSAVNVGAIMRAAGCYGASAIYFSGKRFARAAKYQLDTKNIQRNIPLQQVESITELKNANTKLVCFEFVVGAKPLPEFQHPENAIYVFGPEDGSIDQNIIDIADAVVYVPTTGCMNLAASVNVLLYDRMAKQNLILDNEALIKSNRDINNRLRIKNPSG